MEHKHERIRLATHPYTAKDGHMPMQHICLPEMMEQLEATGSIQQKMIVNFVDRMDDFIIDAVMNDARNQGATEVMLFDRKWVKEAIIEKAERAKGCDHCLAVYEDSESWANGEPHGIRIDGQALLCYGSDGWEGEQVQFCPWCGRNLLGGDNT